VVIGARIDARGWRYGASGHLSRAAAPCHFAEVDVTVDVPDVDVCVKAGRSPAQADFYTANVFARIQLQVTNVIGVNTSDKVIVSFLLFSYCLGGTRRGRRLVGFADV
jgi:hypothetical protein